MADTSTDPRDEQPRAARLAEPVASSEAGPVSAEGAGPTTPAAGEAQAAGRSAPSPRPPAPKPQIEQVAFVWDDRLWRDGFGVRHPLRPKRLLRLYRLLESSGALNWRETQMIPPDAMDPAILSEYHTPDYVQAVRALSEGHTMLLRPAAYGFGPQRTPATPGMWAAHTAQVAAALTAARVVREGIVPRAFTPAGGFHHARPAEARAGHLFNDVVLLIKSLLASGLKVAYLDLDVTHGDAVQAAFYDTDRVLTISLHEGPQYFFFPETGWPQEIGEAAGKGYTVNLALPPGTADDHYLWAFEEIVPPLLSRFQPDVIVTQTGLGAHFADELAHLRLTTEGFSRLWRRVRALAPRWVAVGGGGLNLDVAARGWSLAYAVIADREAALPRRLPRRYAERWGQGEFHDEPLEAPSKELNDYIWGVVRGQVAALQRGLFPLHRLQPPPLVPGIAFEPFERPVTAPVVAPPSRSAPPAPLPPAMPARRPFHHQPAGPILPEPEEDEETEELLDFSESEQSASPSETAGESKQRRSRRRSRSRRGRRASTSSSRAQATQGQASEGHSGAQGAEESAGGSPGTPPPAADIETTKSGRRRSGRRGRSHKKSD
ncbi:MAG TPA: hypothetical protein DEP84_06410 [Chloroflexi bacterium]|nr:hypothetical protein [Chloroflexota bacterium]